MLPCSVPRFLHKQLPRAVWRNGRCVHHLHDIAFEGCGVCLKGVLYKCSTAALFCSRAVRCAC
jgi:hypothetical protein